MFAAAAHASGDAMAKLRHHRIIGRALGDLGQYPLAQPHLDLTLQPGRKAMRQSALNAYEIDHWVAARAKRARILWLRRRIEAQTLERLASPARQPSPANRIARQSPSVRHESVGEPQSSPPSTTCPILASAIFSV